MTGKWADKIKAFRAVLTRLGRERGGGLMTYTAILIPVLLGFAGMSVDIGYWYANARLAQSAADSAAIAGSLEVVRSGGNEAQITAAALAQAVNSGFSPGYGDTVTVNIPPLSGPNAGRADFVEVVIVGSLNTFFSWIVFDEEPRVAARAVAKAGNTDTCVWALNPSISGAVNVSGSAEVELSCSVFVNSSSGLTQSGSGCLEASKIKVGGNYSVDCSTPEPEARAFSTIDPLASLPPPAMAPVIILGTSR
ncbi:MAG: pilus assembly protein TadG-related protein [Kiloniellales bacterium]